ncbi:energy-coupled thiamine transporter ThiT [Sedimentibacter sp. MB31-C6]|uniref:energy-coupled thiamine transporter ThiT n=1 Tax=Sedimentibacter sp. MB31-C6 TaxID=3109366 RepID=UPI002DDD0A47|nr:energy-coupled thiamine transporter ThiT [Sedimentibacter sp. MB36-C1]WSI05544.1 energy-coupled thiamine transporter ThiT [Sedimentibacter sp. MB36-C1]
MSEEVLQSFFESVPGQITTVVVIFLLLILIMRISGKKNNVSIMVKTAILIGLTFVLNQITLFRMPQGGSITAFGMLALFLVSYLFGARQGILAGMAYGLLDLIINPSVIHPIQIFMDYPLAFGAIGIGGMLRSQSFGIIKGYILGVIGRYIVVVISGIVFWGMYAAEGFNAVSWSLFYNMTYILPEAAITVIILLVPQLRQLFDRFKIND